MTTRRELSEAELRRIARHMNLPGFSMLEAERLYNSHVLIVGAGGLGCPILQQLVAAGVGTITLVDDDYVDLSNIHRQILFGAADVGKRKVDIASQKVRDLQPGVCIHTHAQRITADNALHYVSAADLVIDGSDTFATKYLIADAAELSSTPLVWGTVLQFYGTVALWHSGLDTPDGRGVGLRDLFPTQPPANAVPDCATAGVLGVTTSVIGGLMATETIGWLAGFDSTKPGRLVSYNALAAEVKTMTVAADPDRSLVTMLHKNYAPMCSLNDTSSSSQRDSTAEDTQKHREILLAHVEEGTAIALDIREPHEKYLKDLPAQYPRVRLPLSQIENAQDIRAVIGAFTTVVVFCAAGNRSQQLVQRYTLEGVKLYSLPGGLAAGTVTE